MSNVPETAPGKKFWQRDKVHYPRPVRPLFVSFGLQPVEVGSARANADWSIPVDRHRYLVQHGYVYQRSEPVGGDPPPAMSRLPALFHLWRINPELRRRIMGFERFLQEGGFENHVFSWKNIWKPEAELRTKTLQAFDRSRAADTALADHLDACYDYLCWSWEPHFKIVMMCVYVRGRWTRLCRDLFDLTEFEAYELVQGTNPELFFASNHLAQIAQRIKGEPSTGSILEKPGTTAYKELQGTWVAREIEDFLHRHGDRPVDTYELDPTWREMPELVVGMIKDLLQADANPQEEQEAFEKERQARLLALRARLSSRERERFDHWLKLTEEAYPLIDTHDYLLANIPASLVRYDAVEAGRRLVARGKLGDPEETLFLYREELTEVLRSDGNPKDLVAARKVEHQRNLTLSPPDALGTRPAQPPLRVFPPRVSEAMAILLEEMQKVETQGDDGFLGIRDGRLVGLPGAAGVAEGPVRIVMVSDDFSRVQPGDILVCPFTTPSWTVLFPKVAALVTDSGGSLSHAAIVAREYGLPSVVGTGAATKELKDGEWVRVNGHEGVVELLEGTEGGGRAL